MLNKYYVVKAILLCNGVLTFLDRGSIREILGRWIETVDAL